MTHAVSEITNFCIVLLFPLSCFINLIYGMSTLSCFRTEWIVTEKKKLEKLVCLSFVGNSST